MISRLAPARLARGVVRRWLEFSGARILRCAGVDFGAGVRALGRPIVDRFPESDITIGDRTVLCSSSRWTALGVSHPLILRTVRSGARIRIGAETGISGGSICAAVSVEIGSRCLLGADVLIVDTDFHAIEPIGRRTNTDWSRIGCAPVHIGDDVFIGARAIILKGVSVGAGAVIGAGSVVTRSVPEGVIVAGNPAIAVGSVDGRRRFAGSLQLHAFDS